jgi:DNA-binding MarR family transcriptional regulator
VDDDDAVRLRRAVMTLARKFNASATDEDLTPTQASVLGLVVGRPGISLTELHRLEQLNPTMLSRVVGKLVDADLVVRTPDPDDLRSGTLRSTSAGRARQKRVRARRAAAVARGAEGLTDAELRALVAALPALEKLADAVE